MDLRERIKGTNDFKREPLEFQGWGDDLFVRKLSGPERLDWDRWLAEHKDDDGGERTVAALARMVRLAVVKGDGTQVFEESDEDWLRHKSLEALEAIFEQAGRFNAMSKAAKEEAEKNSENSRLSA